MTFPETFLTPSKPGRRPITAAKGKPKGKKEREKKNSKVEKPKAVGQNFDFYACLGQDVLKAILVARTASCLVTNAFSTRLMLNWPRSSFKTTKMSKKKQFWQKVPGVNGLI